MVNKKSDLIIVNASIYPLTEEGLVFNAMSIKNGKIVGFYNTEPKNPGKLAKKVFNANGRAIIPGLIDSHFHFIATAALEEFALKISEIHEDHLEPNNFIGLKKKLIDFAKSLPKKKPLLAFGYIITGFKEARLPTVKEIDKWLPDRIVIIISMDGHSSSYSSLALKELEIKEEEHNGTGILEGPAHEFHLGKLNTLILKHLNLSTLVKSIIKLTDRAIKNGLVGIHCLDGFEDLKKDPSLFLFSRIAPHLPLKLRLFVQFKDYRRVLEYKKYMRYPRLGGCGGWEQDGSVGSQTAAFYHPYKNNPKNKGIIYFSKEEMRKYVCEAQNAGFQITSHAIGPAAIEVILDAYEYCQNKGDIRKKRTKTRGKDSEQKKKESEVDKNPFRHRIDHFEFPTKKQVTKAIEELNLLITAQPGYSWMDNKYQQTYQKYLTSEQFNTQIPLKTIINKGGILCGSSDSPVQDLNPFIQIHGMVNFPIKQERLSVYQALRCYTNSGAYSTFEEKSRGTLEIGKSADFIVLDRDPFKIPNEQLITIKPKTVFIDGKEYKKGYSTNWFLLILKCFLSSPKKI